MKKGVVCFWVSMFATRVTDQSLDYLHQLILRCHNTTLNTSYKRKVKKLCLKIWKTQLLQLLKNSKDSIMETLQLTLSSIVMVFRTPNVKWFWKKKFSSLKMRLRWFTKTKQLRILKSLLSLLTRESINDSLWLTQRQAKFSTHPPVVLLINNLSIITMISANLTSTCPLCESIKVVYCLLISSVVRMIQRWQRQIWLTWHLLYVTSTSTGLVRSKCLLLVCTATRLLSSLWILVELKRITSTLRLLKLNLWLKKSLKCDHLRQDCISCEEKKEKRKEAESWTKIFLVFLTIWSFDL